MAAIAAKQDEEKKRLVSKSINDNVETSERQQWPFAVYFTVCLFSDVDTVCLSRRVCKTFATLSEWPALWLRLIHRDFPHYKLLSVSDEQDDADRGGNAENDEKEQKGRAAAAAASAAAKNSRNLLRSSSTSRREQRQQQRRAMNSEHKSSPNSGALGSDAFIEDRARFIYELGDIFFCPGRACYSFVMLSANFPRTMTNIVNRSVVSRQVNRELKKKAGEEVEENASAAVDVSSSSAARRAASAAAHATCRGNIFRGSNNNNRTNSRSSNSSNEDPITDNPYVFAPTASGAHGDIQEEMNRIEQSLHALGDPFLDVEGLSVDDDGDDDDASAAAIGLSRRQLIRVYSTFHVKALSPTQQTPQTLMALGTFSTVRPEVAREWAAKEAKKKKAAASSTSSSSAPAAAATPKSRIGSEDAKISAPRQQRVPLILFSDMLYLFSNWHESDPAVSAKNSKDGGRARNFNKKKQQQEEEAEGVNNLTMSYLIEWFRCGNNHGPDATVKRMQNESDNRMLAFKRNFHNYFFETELTFVGLFFVLTFVPLLLLRALGWWLFDPTWFFLRWPRHALEMLLGPIVSVYWTGYGAQEKDGSGAIMGRPPPLDSSDAWWFLRGNNDSSNATATMMNSSSTMVGTIAFFSSFLFCVPVLLFAISSVGCYVLTRKIRKYERQVAHLPRLYDSSTLGMFCLQPLVVPLAALGLGHFVFHTIDSTIRNVLAWLTLPWNFQRAATDMFLSWVGALASMMFSRDHFVRILLNRTAATIMDEFEALGRNHSNSTNSSDNSVQQQQPVSAQSYYNVHSLSFFSPFEQSTPGAVAPLWAHYPTFIFCVLMGFAMLRVLTTDDDLKSVVLQRNYEYDRLLRGGAGSNYRPGYVTLITGHYRAQDAVTRSWKDLLTAAMTAHENLFVKKCRKKSRSQQQPPKQQQQLVDKNKNASSNNKNFKDRFRSLPMEIKAELENNKDRYKSLIMKLESEWRTCHAGRVSIMAAGFLILFFCRCNMFLMPVLQLVCIASSTAATVRYARQVFIEQKGIWK